MNIQAGSVLSFVNGNGLSDPELVLQANTILVTGKLEIGTESSLFVRKARIVLINDKMPIARYLEISFFYL